MHISHSIFWVNMYGVNPPPYTVIHTSDIESGVWRPRDSSPEVLVSSFELLLSLSSFYSMKYK